MLNLSWITKKFFPNRSAKSINYGSCFNWALMAYLLENGRNGNSGQLVTFDEYDHRNGDPIPRGWHAGVKFGNLYYDSESPLGVREWRNLKSFRRDYDIDLKAFLQPLTEFRDYWKGIGLNRNLMPVAEELVKKYQTLGIADPLPIGRSNLF